MELQEVLESVPFDELLKTVLKKARTGNKDVANYIKGILQGCSDGSDENEKRRFETFKSALSIFQMPEISHNLVSEIVSILLLKVDSFHTSNLVNLAEFFVDYAKSASNFGVKWLEVFAKVLSCLYLRDTIVYQGDDMSGKELRKNILISLFSEDIEVPTMIQLVSVLKDIELSEDELKLVSETLLKVLPKVELSNLPSFIYQLLLLSSKGQRQQILQNVSSYFIKKDNDFWNKDDDAYSEDLCGDDLVLYRQTEGTVILMISVNSRHDQSICKDYCILLKKIQHKPEIILSPFSFACSLSLSKTVSGKDDLFDTLKKSLTLAYQLKDKKKTSHWMREMIPSSPDILKLIKETVKCSRYGWDHVSQGLVRFGFSAIDTFGPRYVLGGTAVKIVLEEGCILGNHILRDTFKNHRIMRTEILDQILNRIITKSQKPVKHYIDILSQIVQSDPLFLLEILPKLVEILDFIHLVPHSNAIDILHALAPLLRISMPLKDTLMLVLRKALFHRDIGARKVAVSGYLMILKKLTSIGRVSLSQSQTSVSSQASSASMISTQVKADVYVSAGNPSSKTMCLEIMGLLKRVLMQQDVVRQLLYEGLYDAVLQNKFLKDIVLELLLGQLEKYYDKDDSSDLPLQFSLCFNEQKDTATFEEPLAHLLTVIHLILRDSDNISDDDDDYDQSAQKLLEDILQNLLKKMSHIDISDLNVNSKDPDDTTNNGSKTNFILNCYETLLEYALMQNKDYNLVLCEEFLSLFQKYKEISNTLNSKKQKKSSKANVVSAPMHVTIRFFAEIIEGLFANVTFKHQEGLNLIRNDSSFVLHIVSACNQKLSKYAENGKSDNFSYALMKSFYYISSIAKVYFKVYMEGLNTDFPSNDFPTLELEKLPLSFVEGLTSIFTYITTFQQKKSSTFIIDVCAQDCLSTAQSLNFILESIQKTIVKLLADTENDVNIKEIIPLLSIINILYKSFSEEFNEDIYKWLKQLCVQQTFQNTSISKSIISLAFTLVHHQSLDCTFFREVAFDIHYHLGDIDPDESVARSSKYNIITPEVSRSVLSSLISNLDIVMDEIELMLNYMKANVAVPPELFSVCNNKDKNQQTMEQGICTRLSDLISVLYEIVQTVFPPDSFANMILKLVGRFYKVLSSLSKYYLLLHTKSKTMQLHTAFEKLVKLSHLKLTTYVYAFITYVQVVSGNDSGKKKKTNSAATSKAMREIKTIPTLVFAIESYEKELILLSKKFNKNLVNHMKLSTARDFRINAAALTSLIEQQVDESSISSSISNSSVQNEQMDENEVIEQINNQEEDNEELPNNETGREVSDHNEPMEEDSNQSHDENSNIPDNVIKTSITSKKLNRSKANTNSKVMNASKDDTDSKLLTRSKASTNSKVMNTSKDDTDSKLLNTSKTKKVLSVKRKRLGVRATSKKSK